MATDVDICNMALSFLGEAATLSSIEPPEGSTHADTCARFYPIALQDMLATHPWSFAIKRQELAELTDEPITVRDEKYFQLPSDCLNVIQLVTEDGVVVPRYSIEKGERGRVLVAAIESGWVRYVTANVEESAFPPKFTLALAHRLASLMAGTCVPGATGAEMGNNQLKLYMEFLGQAQVADAQQQFQKPVYPPKFLGGIHLREDDNVYY